MNDNWQVTRLAGSVLSTVRYRVLRVYANFPFKKSKGELQTETGNVFIYLSYLTSIFEEAKIHQ